MQIQKTSIEKINQFPICKIQKFHDCNETELNLEKVVDAINYLHPPKVTFLYAVKLMKLLVFGCIII